MSNDLRGGTQGGSGWDPSRGPEGPRGGDPEGVRVCPGPLLATGPLRCFPGPPGDSGLLEDTPCALTSPDPLKSHHDQTSSQNKQTSDGCDIELFYYIR